LHPLGSALERDAFSEYRTIHVVFSLVEWRSALSCGDKCRRPLAQLIAVQLLRCQQHTACHDVQLAKPS
jgi:hypothetical protein